ncbi:MAG: bifunctional phosphopantothenoylcysteine decarboxylase/phosphopantothenate--cysteine ligase CoaBC [Acidobacteria bacterium]|nr:bifunctional phosphopantothenoylcysteine decarboxylase/phosphopantothenate--cysteine ligase CoaBC [Acidobacteriota bacterium]
MALVALGVCGGIGAYKAVEVARGLQQRGHDVAAVLTANAARFVGPLTFEAITRRPVAGDQFAPGVNAQIEHIALASDLELLLVAPATANILGKFANGIADDFLSALYLATTAPVLVAPAMNTNMLAHPAVAANLDRLAERGVRFVEPGEGYLACGWGGRGRLAEPGDVVAAADRILGSGRSLAGRRGLVTAGPTVEDLDPVRYLGNRSSGRMGYAVAAEALARGAQVVLVTGPSALEPPAGAEVVRVRGAEEMRTAVMARVAGDGDGVDLVVMVAAVADYTPAGGARDAKLLRDRDELVLTLRRTPDILAALGRWRAGRDRPALVGFAAEVGDPVARAREKLRRKQVDLVVANDVSRPGAGFGGDTNVATLVTDTEAEEVPLGTKRELARVLLDRVEPRLAPLASGAEGAR